MSPTCRSLRPDASARPPLAPNFAAVFYGLGSDGTVSANKNSIKIIGDETELYAQGYFVYDSKKSGAMTVSHLRFGLRADPLGLPDRQWRFTASSPATSRCSTPTTCSPMPRRAGSSCSTPTDPAEQIWDRLPAWVQQQHRSPSGLHFYVIDAYKVAQEADMGRRINTVMQTCFFAISGILPRG